MILHFIFVVKEEDREKRQFEFEYIQKMSQFYKVWIKEKFGKDYERKPDRLLAYYKKRDIESASVLKEPFIV